MGTIEDRVDGDLRLRGFSKVTCVEYRRRLKHFLAHHQVPPEQLSAEDIRRYMLHLVDDLHLGPANQKTTIAAMIHEQMRQNLTSSSAPLEGPPPAKSPRYAHDLSTGANSHRLCPDAPPVRATGRLVTPDHRLLAVLPLYSPAQLISPYAQFPPYAVPDPCAPARTLADRSAA